MGPLTGFRFIELAGIGPTQFAGMLFADLGADVIRVERPAGAAGHDPGGIPLPRRYNLMNRSRRSVAIDLKTQAGVDIALRLVAGADALYEGFRPGVAERLGLGPEVCLECAPRLVYGRMTGWGQDGPLADAVGHDPNYIALAGALYSMGPSDRAPTIPLNLVGDFGGGALYLVAGMLAALLETSRSGRGQVVDAAMVDGAASLMTLFFGLSAAGLWSAERGRNIFDGGAHFHRAYETRDGKFVVVGALEPKFHAELLERLEIELDPAKATAMLMDPSRWQETQRRMAEVFRTKTRDQWCELLEGTEACLSPVLSLDEAPSHPHNRARRTFDRIDGVLQPGPSPRFSRTPGEIRNPPPALGRDTRQVLLENGLTDREIERLANEGTIACAPDETPRPEGTP